jgi:hypothetical protein
MYGMHARMHYWQSGSRFCPLDIVELDRIEETRLAAASAVHTIRVAFTSLQHRAECFFLFDPC